MQLEKVAQPFTLTLRRDVAIFLQVTDIIIHNLQDWLLL